MNIKSGKMLKIAGKKINFIIATMTPMLTKLNVKKEKQINKRSDSNHTILK